MTPRPIIVPALLLLFGCAGLKVETFRESPGDWSMMGGSPARANALDTRMRFPLREVWQYNAQAGIRAVPLIRDNNLVVATLNGELQIVSLAEGKRIGYKSFESAIVGTPALYGVSVIFAMSGKTETVISYNLILGKKNWGFQAGPVESSPLVVADRVYFGTLRGEVYCLQAGSGERIWKYEGEGIDRFQGFRSSPAMEGPLIVIGSDDGNLYAINSADGSLVWKRQTGGGVFATPVLTRGMAVAGNLNGTITAVDLRDGTVRWKAETGATVYGSAATDGKTIYCGASNGIVYAFDLEGGLKWKFATKAVLNSAPLVTGNAVLIGSMDRVLYALDVANGGELWRYETEGRIRVTPVLWGDGLLVTFEDKYIAMLRPS